MCSQKFRQQYLFHTGWPQLNPNNLKVQSQHLSLIKPFDMFFSSGWGDQVRCGGYPLKSGHTHPNVQLCLKSVATNPRTTHNQQRFSSLQSSKMYMWSFISLSSRILCQIFLVNTITVLGAHTTDCWLCLGILAHVTERQRDFSFSLQIKKPG